jgi:hypothetical protein
MTGTIPCNAGPAQQGFPTLGFPSLFYSHFPACGEMDIPVLPSIRHHVSKSTGGTEFP